MGLVFLFPAHKYKIDYGEWKTRIVGVYDRNNPNSLQFTLIVFN